jgi:hypothetical protein
MRFSTKETDCSTGAVDTLDDIIGESAVFDCRAGSGEYNTAAEVKTKAYIDRLHEAERAGTISIGVDPAATYGFIFIYGASNQGDFTMGKVQAAAVLGCVTYEIAIIECGVEILEMYAAAPPIYAFDGLVPGEAARFEIQRQCCGSIGIINIIEICFYCTAVVAGYIAAERAACEVGAAEGINGTAVIGGGCRGSRSSGCLHRYNRSQCKQRRLRHQIPESFVHR